MAVMIRRVIALVCLISLPVAARAEHGSPGDFLDEPQRIPQFGYLIVNGMNGITDDLWHLVKRPRRLVSDSGGQRHVVPLRLVAFYDREVPDFRGAGGYGENCVVLQPRRRLRAGRDYHLEYRVRSGRRSTWRRIARSQVSLLAAHKRRLRLRLVSASHGPASSTDPSPIITLRIRGGTGKRVWLASQVTRLGRLQPGQVRNHWRHFAIEPTPTTPSWLGRCVFHPISGSGATVLVRFRVSDRRRQHTRWSRRLRIPAHGQLNVCVVRR